MGGSSLATSLTTSIHAPTPLFTHVCGPTIGAAILSHFTNAVVSLHTQYSRYGQVDAAMYAHFECVTVPNAPDIQPHENALFAKSLLFEDDSQTENKFRRINGTVSQSVSYHHKLESKAGAFGKAVATIDASAARVAAWLLCFMSYERIDEHIRKNGRLMRRQFHLSDQRGSVFLAVQKFPGALENRFFAIWWSWKREDDGTYILAFADVDEYMSAEESGNDLAVTLAWLLAEQLKRRERDGKGEELETLVRERMEIVLLSLRGEASKKRMKELNDIIGQTASKAVRGSTRGFWRIKPLANNVCEATVCQQGQLGGSIPLFVVNARVLQALRVNQRLQDKFARNGKIVDKEMRDAFPTPSALADLSEEQIAVFESCRYLESEDGSEWKTLTPPSPLVQMWMKHAPAKKNERSVAIGKATAVIDCPMDEAIGKSSEASASRAARRALRASSER